MSMSDERSDDAARSTSRIRTDESSGNTAESSLFTRTIPADDAELSKFEASLKGTKQECLSGPLATLTPEIRDFTVSLAKTVAKDHERAKQKSAAVLKLSPNDDGTITQLLYVKG